MLASPFEQYQTHLNPNHSLERNIWCDHTDPILNPLERAWWLLGRDSIYKSHLEVHNQLGLPALDNKALYEAHRVTVAKAVNWNGAASRFAKLTKQKSGFSHNDLQTIATATVDNWYKNSFVEDRARARAVRTWLAGHLLNNPRTEIPSAAAPIDWQNAAHMFKLRDRDAEAVQEAEQNAAQHVQNMREQSKAALREVITEGIEEHEHPEQTASELLNRFGKLNRDWRRIAITETNGAYHGGMLGALVGKTVVWVAAGDACPHCKQYHNHEFAVVARDASNKNWDTELWPGKTNVGRSFYQYTRDGRRRTDNELAKPTISMHPHCRCRVRPTLSVPQNMNSDVRKYIQKKLATD